MDAEELYRQHLPSIGQIAISICRRYGVDQHDAEDFASDIRLKLCDNDFAIIRKFQGRSSFITYITTVITRSFLDHRRRVWGKWRPSSQAKRLGTVAMLLETLVHRDGHSFESACQILEQKHGAAVDRRAMRAMLVKLPVRAPRRVAGDESLAAVPSNSGADDSVLSYDRDQQLAAAEEALRTALARLPDEDRAIIRMFYYEGLSVADIARGLHLDQKRLYPHIKRLLASLRQTLKSLQVSAAVLEELDTG
ncbi:MAG TPA: sigma-70 family RNA polymerase sigma factor [Gemmatimonadaceae bacterium]